MKEAHYTPFQQNQTAWGIYNIYSLNWFLLWTLKFCYISSLCRLNENQWQGKRQVLFVEDANTSTQTVSDLSHWMIRAGKDQQQVKSATWALIDAAEETVVPKQQTLQVTGMHFMEGRIVWTTEQSSVRIRDDDSSKFSEVEEEVNEQRQSVRKKGMRICSD